MAAPSLTPLRPEVGDEIASVDARLAEIVDCTMTVDEPTPAHPRKSPYRSGPSESWIKVKNPKAPAATWPLMGPSNFISILLSETPFGAVAF